MNKIVYIFFLIFFTTPVFAAEVKLSDGSVYSGNLKEGLFDGIATQIWSNGDKYEGEFSKGMLNGKGKLITKLFTYEGFF
jgi:hypothetical protein